MQVTLPDDNMVSLDDYRRAWHVDDPGDDVTCPVCSFPMLRYENPERWLCFNIKLHDRALDNGLS
jgi:hypothetical protein